MPDATIPVICDRAGCHDEAETFCPLCSPFFCAKHDELPRGHVCLSTLFNATPLDPAEHAAALERFRPI